MRLEFHDISKAYGSKEVLKGISLCAESGRAFALLGRNGAGKTTSIRILMDVMKADSGSLTLDGQPFCQKDWKIGYLPEEKGLYPKLEILRQMVYIAELRGLSNNEAKQRALAWLKRLDMESVAKSKLETLSKGNQQKIQLAVALITDPDIIILDEPFSGLDPVNAQVLKEIVREEVQRGKIVFFSSHQMAYVETFCDDIAILYGGHIALSGSLSQIRQTYPKTKYSIRFANSDGQILPAEAAQNLVAPYVLNSTIINPMLLHIERRPDDQLEPLLNAMLTQGYHPEIFTVHEPTLEDLFIRYTTDTEEQRPDLQES